MIFFAVIVYLVLVFVLSINEKEVEFSEFEISRRINEGDKRAEKLLIKKRVVPLFNRVRGFLATALAILLALIVAGMLKFWDASLVVFGLIGAGFILSRTDFARGVSKKIFKEISPKIYAVFMSLKPKTQKKLLKLSTLKPYTPYSMAELLDFLRGQKKILSEQEIIWWEQIAKLHQERVGDWAENFDLLDILHEKDLLTPLVIDELFKTKREIFPVMDVENKAVLGVVKMSEIGQISADSKRVRTVMEREFLTLSADKSALDSLETLLATSQTFAVVKNKKGQHLGLLHLETLLPESKGK